jgi:hypothetical protein
MKYNVFLPHKKTIINPKIKIMKTLSTLFFAALSSIVFAQIPNACFDTWSGGNPTQWVTGNSFLAGTTTQSSTVHGTCTSAVSLNSVGGLGGFVESISATDPYFYNSGNPEALNGWYILKSDGNDYFEVEVGTKCPDTVNSGLMVEYTTSTSVYKQFSVCLTYSHVCTADSAYIFLALNSSTTTGNGDYVIVDGLSFGTCATAIEDIKSNVDLEPSYPNPASDICNIIYSIRNSGEVNVSLYDISGRKMMNLLDNTRQTSGRYKIPVDVHSLANGVYVYIITVDGVSYSQKLTVEK